MKNIFLFPKDKILKKKKQLIGLILKIGTHIGII